MTHQLFLSFDLFKMKKIYDALHERERGAKVSSALTQMRRNARSVAKRMFELLPLFPSHEGGTLL